MVRDVRPAPDDHAPPVAAVAIAARRGADSALTTAKSPSPGHPWLRARIASLDAIERTNLVMLFALCAVTPVTFGAVPGNAWLLAGYAAMAVLLATAPRIRLPWIDFPRRFRQAYPLVYIALIFHSLGRLLPHVNPRVADDLLVRCDVALCGVVPTQALERFVAPWAVEALFYVYAAYFVLPFVLLVALWRAGRTDLVHRWVALVTLALYANYLCYLVVPARGPYLALTHDVPLDGGFAAGPLRRLFDSLEANKYDVFPSAHVNAALVTLYGFAAYLRRHVALATLLVVGIAVSTVYLRYHYVTDVVAGVALAAASVVSGERIYRRLHGRVAP